MYISCTVHKSQSKKKMGAKTNLSKEEEEPTREMPHFREQPTWKSLFSTTLILYFFSLVLLPARYFSPAVALSHLFPLNPLAPKLQCTFSFYRMCISNTTAIHHRSSPPHSKRFFFSLFRCPYIHQMDSSPFIFLFYLNLFFFLPHAAQHRQATASS